MNTTRVLIPVAAMLGLAGCCTIPEMISLLPLFTETETVFDDALLGKWQEKGESTILEILKDGDKGYVVRNADPDPSAKKDDDALHFTMGRIGGILFVSFSQPDRLGHWFAKVTFDRGHIEVYPIDTDWLKEKVVEQNQLAHMELPYAGCKVMAISAPTSELQYFMLRYGTDPDAFEPVTELKRVE